MMLGNGSPVGSMTAEHQAAFQVLTMPAHNGPAVDLGNAAQLHAAWPRSIVQPSLPNNPNTVWMHRAAHILGQTMSNGNASAMQPQVHRLGTQPNTNSAPSSPVESFHRTHSDLMTTAQAMNTYGQCTSMPSTTATPSIAPQQMPPTSSQRLPHLLLASDPGGDSTAAALAALWLDNNNVNLRSANPDTSSAFAVDSGFCDEDLLNQHIQMSLSAGNNRLNTSAPPGVQPQMRAPGTEGYTGGRVKLVLDPNNKQNYQPPSTMSLYITGLPPEADDLFLYETFAPYGALHSCKIKTHPVTGQCSGVGFVNFVDGACAARAMQRFDGVMTTSGRQLHITLQAPRAVRAAAARATGRPAGMNGLVEISSADSSYDGVMAAAMAGLGGATVLGTAPNGQLLLSHNLANAGLVHGMHGLLAGNASNGVTLVMPDGSILQHALGGNGTTLF